MTGLGFYTASSRPAGVTAVIILLLASIVLLQFTNIYKTVSNDQYRDHFNINGFPAALEKKGINHWEAPLPKCTTARIYQAYFNMSSTAFRVSSGKESGENFTHNETVTVMNDPTCATNICNFHSFCYLGSCICYPGYHGAGCSLRIVPANPWYTDSCPNLLSSNTLNISVPLHMVGGEHTFAYNLLHTTESKNFSESPEGHIKCFGSSNSGTCAYLCFSHPEYGTAVVPLSLWRAAQEAEGSLWVAQASGTSSSQNDRAAEHWAAFNSFSSISTLISGGLKLGRVIEVGAGPWTQFKGILHSRPLFVPSVAEFTVWEPNAKRYMANVTSCSYRGGEALYKWDGSGTYPFPVTVRSDGGELLSRANSVSTDRNASHSSNAKSEEYDTLISINVIEHTQDAFQYLSGLFSALKPGGLLIFHDRYYRDEGIPQGDLYHPVRIKRIVLDHFLVGFNVLFNNCSAGYDGRVGEEGYYVIALKL